MRICIVCGQSQCHDTESQEAFGKANALTLRPGTSSAEALYLFVVFWQGHRHGIESQGA